MLVVAGDVARATSAGPVSIERLVHRLQHLRIAAHAQIVVRAPDRHALLRGGRVGPRKLLGEPVDVVEVAVRFVLVLLLQFAVVERTIIKWRTDRRTRSWSADRGFGGSGGRGNRVGQSRTS